MQYNAQRNLFTSLRIAYKNIAIVRIADAVLASAPRARYKKWAVTSVLKFEINGDILEQGGAAAQG